MICLQKNQFVYIPIAKNGSTTFKTLLSNAGWEEINLLQTELDLNTVKLWAHITHPERRHTKGLAEFLKRNPDIDFDYILKHDALAKVFINSMVDAHSASIGVTLGPLCQLPIHWIPLDAKILNYSTPEPTIVTGNDLTNDFFIENGISVRVTNSDLRYQASDQDKIIRQQIDNLKEKFKVPADKILGDPVQTFFNYDLILYFDVLERFTNKYTKKNRSWLN